MFHLTIGDLNYFGGFVLSHLLNAALPTGLAIAAVVVLARGKHWDAASRYCAWWLLTALVIAAPFIPHLERKTAGAAAGTNLEILHDSAPAMVVHFKPAVAHTPVQTDLPSAPAVFLFCWSAAALLQLTRVTRGVLRTFELKRSASPAPAEITNRFEQLLSRAALARPVKLGISEELESPAVLGYRAPQILLPAALLAHLDANELEQILVHELAHVQRWDDWSILVQRILEAVGIFHPFIAYLAHRLNLDREMACDDRAAQGCEPRRYAACLTRAAEIRHFGSSSPITMPLLLERKSELLARVENLLDPTRGHRPATSLTRLALAFTCAATAAIAAGFTPGIMPAPEPPVASLGLPQAPQPPAPAAPAKSPAPPVAPKMRKPDGSISQLSVTDESGSTTSWGNSESPEKTNEPGTIMFSSGGKRYVIRDKSTVSEAARILAPMEDLGRQQAALGKQQAQFGEQQALLGAQQAALAAAPLDSAEMARLHQQLADLESKFHQIDLQKEVKTAEEAMTKLASLQEQIASIQQQMGTLQGLSGDRQGKLGEQQGKLGEMQGHLGEMQGKLGEQQARECQKAQSLLEDLVRRAQQRGLARPQP